jgi:hypothetical protein
VACLAFVHDEMLKIEESMVIASYCFWNKRSHGKRWDTAGFHVGRALCDRWKFGYSEGLHDAQR